MLKGRCKSCDAESTSPEYFAGLTIRCKACGDGWVSYPPGERASVAKPAAVPPPPARPPTPAPVPARATTPAAPVTAPRPQAPVQEPVYVRPYPVEEKPPADGGWELPSLGRVGGTMVALGLGSLVLPALGLQFRAMRNIEDAQPGAGLGAALLGGFLLFVSARSAK